MCCGLRRTPFFTASAPTPLGPCSLWALMVYISNVGKVKGHAQKALHAVHVDEGAIRDGVFQALHVQSAPVSLLTCMQLTKLARRPGLFEALHSRARPLCPREARALRGPFRAGARRRQHRGVFRGVDGHELFSVHALHRAEDGEVGGLRAAGGEDEFFPPARRSFPGSPRGRRALRKPEGRHRRAVDGRGVVPALLHALCHRADDERRGPRGGAVVQICFHNALYAPSHTSAER